MSMIALPWFIVSTTGSALLTGVAAFAQMAPYVLAKALGGPMIDQFGPRRVVIAGEVASAFAITLVPVLHFAGALTFPVLCALVVLVGATSGPADGAKQAAVPAVAHEAGVPLERVTGLMGAIERFAVTVGAAAAGALVAWIGAVSVLLLTAAAFLVAALIFAGAISPTRSAPEGSYVARLYGGAVFIVRDRSLRLIYGVVATANLLEAALMSVVLPVWAHETGRGPASIGLLAAMVGAGGVAAGVFAAMIGPRLSRRWTFVIGFLIAGVPRFIVLAVEAPMGVVVGVWLVSGLAGGMLNPVIGAVIFTRIPDAMTGRVTSIGTSIAWTGMPLGGLVGGVLLGGVGVSGGLAVLGGVYLATSVLPVFTQGWRQMDRPAR